ncbi:MAG: hypothetical protein LBE09_04475 [Christensenellaceae bacterium]|jgi:hypothetical protein|nr:hypothetical protein [Christensenellaceae bacterium]
MGLFCNVEGYLVINAPEYRELGKEGDYVLAEYARENLDECTMKFSYNIAEQFEINTITKPMGPFRNVEGYLVINAPEYLELGKEGDYVLTEYARENLDECTI